MKILFTTPSLRTGGIEVQALRMSEAFQKAGHEVILYDFYPLYKNKQLIANYDTSRFRIAGTDEYKLPDWLTWKVHAALYKTGVYKNLKPVLIERHFANLLAHERPDVICSLSFHEDYTACKYGRLLNIPVVVSMHGTYEQAGPEWPLKARFIYDNASAVIYSADKNMDWYKSQIYYNPALPATKIYNGVDLTAPIPQSVSRMELGISDGAFVYIMVARGIKEKGWLETINAFREVRSRHQNAVLLLIGEGEYLNGLIEQYINEPGIISYRFHPNPIELVNLADVGLLPSYFSLESLPNVILDYLRCTLPVIGSNIGEIPAMLTVDEKQVAGSILPLSAPDGGVVESQLAEAMENMIANPVWYEEKRQYAKAASQRFALEKCVADFEAVFQYVIAHQAKKSDR